MRRTTWFVSALTAVLLGGCDPATYTDQNFDSDIGADYRAAVREAGADADPAAVGAAGSLGASAGSSGNAGNAATAGSAAATVGTGRPPGASGPGA